MTIKDKTFNCYKKYILMCADVKYPITRKRKYSLKYYLDNFLHMQKDLSRWKALSLVNKDEKDYHWKTIYNEYNKWSKDGIFEAAYIMFIEENYFKMSKSYCMVFFYG